MWSDMRQLSEGECPGIKLFTPCATWEANSTGQAILYFLAMAWCFLGVAIIADIFVAAIEQITSATYVLKTKEGGKHVVPIWNPTVANLSLMALGSSAPEILLSVIETVIGPPAMFAGELGPSTIVGSAAFNLLVISSVCVIAITPGTKKIEDTKVYALTASVSVFAYVWLVIVLMISSPDIVESWEAALTFIFFFLLLLLAFIADKNFFRAPPLEDAQAPPTTEPKSGFFARQNTLAFNKTLFANVKRIKSNGKLDDKEKLRMAIEAMQPVTAATYRHNGMTWLTGKKQRAELDPVTGLVTRPGHADGLAHQRKRMTPDEAPYQRNRVVPVSSASLAEESTAKLGEEESQTRLSRVSTASQPPCARIKFLQETVEVLECEGPALLIITRSGVMDIKATVEYATADMTATAGKDYVAASGTITFEPGEDIKELDIEIIDDDKYEKAETFRVVLSNPSPGAELARRGKQAQVTILNDDEKDTSCRAQIGRCLGFNSDKCDIIMDEWKEQFVCAITPGAEEGEKPTKLQWTIHVITVVWKVLFALVPPPAMLGGWAAFWVALGFIAFLTVLVGDLAALFGCAIGLDPAINAIVFVALGTSMPDLFASKTAAQADSSADASIGNITGSNCVNVFLGLGLPWLIASVYWETSGPTDEWLARYADNKNVQAFVRDNPGKACFVFPAGSLGNSVVIFVACSLLCLLTLFVRRLTFGGELGGPTKPKVATAVFFCLLWLVYLLFSSFSTTGKIPTI